MELLALSSKVRHTDIIKVLLGFLPPYQLLTFKKLEGVFSHVVPPGNVALWCENRYKSNIRGRMTDRPTEQNITESMVKTDQSEFVRRINIAKEIATRQSDFEIQNNTIQ
jgi:hypothetical protein